MIVAASVIGVLILFIIYLVLRGQNLQRELGVARHSANRYSKQSAIALQHLVGLSVEMERDLIARVEDANKRGLIGSKTYPIVAQLMRQFSTVVMYCVEKGMTVEEALTQTTRNQEVSLEDLKAFIKNQPKDVRLAWTSNSLEGYIRACNKLSHNVLLREANAEAESTKEAE